MSKEQYLTAPRAADLLQSRQVTIRRYTHCGVLKALQLPGGDYGYARKTCDR